MHNLIALNRDTASDTCKDERRRHKRKPVLWKAHLEFTTGSAECAILDLSLGGAKLRVAEAIAACGSVTLVIDRFGALAAEVVWTRAGRMGLRFTAPPEAVATTIGTALPLSGR